MQEKRAATFIWHRQSWTRGRTPSYNAAASMDCLLFLHLERNSMDWKGFFVNISLTFWTLYTKCAFLRSNSFWVIVVSLVRNLYLNGLLPSTCMYFRSKCETAMCLKMLIMIMMILMMRKTEESHYSLVLLLSCFRLYGLPQLSPTSFWRSC